MPVNELGVDGAVLFADIMLPLEPMGVSLEIQPDLGPVIHAPIRDMAGVQALRPLDARRGRAVRARDDSAVCAPSWRTAGRRSSASAARRSPWPAT